MEWKRGPGAGARSKGGRFSHPESSSCRCHGYVCFLFDSSQTAERGGAAPSLATTAWGCLQQPLAGFPERDSKPDILRLQNTQVSRAKNSCYRAPGRGERRRLAAEAEGQLRGSHVQPPAARSCRPAGLQSPARLTAGLCPGSPAAQPLTWEPSLCPAGSCPLPALWTLLWDTNGRASAGLGSF